MKNNTGSHEHCFCTLNTAGQPMCCKCGVICDSTIPDFEWFMIQEQVKHLKEKDEHITAYL